MNEKSPKSSGKRGQRRRGNDLEHRSLDHIISDGLNFLSSPDEKVANHMPYELTLDELFNRYYSAREAAGAAERTLEDYKNHMQWFQSFMLSEYNGLNHFLPNREVIRAWIRHMITVQKLKPSTINIRLRTVKAMFSWAMRERILRESPFENVALMRVPEEEFQVITPAQERKMFEVCDLKTFVGIRDALLLSLLLETGVRIGECVRIYESEVDMAKHTIHIRSESAKSRKSRVVYFGRRTSQLLPIYMRWHQRNAQAPNLVLNEYGQPMDREWATRRVSQIGKKAKIRGVRVSPHTFRHTFATRYIKATGDPFSLRRLLGHSSMEMVNRYVNQTTEDVASQYSKFLRADT